MTVTADRATPPVGPQARMTIPAEPAEQLVEAGRSANGLSPHRGRYGSRMPWFVTRLERLARRHQREQAGTQIVAGYRRSPQTEVEGVWPDDATVAMIAAEPW